MEKKFNLVKILENCPKGMELDCTTWENVTFEKVVNNNIIIRRNNKEPYIDTEVVLNQYGCRTNYSDEKCIIFPKGKNTWEGFVPPHQFKDGDVISDDFGSICIFKGEGGIKGTVDFYCGINDGDDELIIKDVKDKDEHFGDIIEYNLSTEEEKQKLFKAIKDNGYKWNAETKKLESLIEPKFKRGDIAYTIFGGIAILGDEYSSRHSECFRSCCVLYKYGFDVDMMVSPKRFATEEEKQKLFKAIKDNGYKWNTETKKLESLIVPKFKKGDKVRVKNGVSEPRIIEDVCDTFYRLIPIGTIDFTIQDCFELAPDNLEGKSNSPKFKVGDRIKHIKGGEAKVVSIEENYYNISSSVGISTISISMQHEWELIPNKFSINNLKPYESRVLVRSANNDVWRPAIYGFTDSNRYFVVGGVFWEKCVPYEGNEHLLGTTKDCDDFYKTWEE